jgi:hypothetical protein
MGRIAYGSRTDDGQGLMRANVANYRINEAHARQVYNRISALQVLDPRGCVLQRPMYGKRSAMFHSFDGYIGPRQCPHFVVR